MVFVTGEAGIGKTTVVDAFVSGLTVRENPSVARGQCLDHHGVGEVYLPVLDALGRLCRAVDGARLLACLEQYAPTWLLQLPALRRATPQAAVHPSAGGPSRERMLREFAEAVEESPEHKKLCKAVREFEGYIAANKPFIPNNGDRYRNGETITTAFVESTVNQVMSKRCVKKQQMKWSKRGAHLLLLVRTYVLNGELRDRFCRWYPGMKTGEEPAQRAA